MIRYHLWKNAKPRNKRRILLRHFTRILFPKTCMAKAYVLGSTWQPNMISHQVGVHTHYIWLDKGAGWQQKLSAFHGVTTILERVGCDPHNRNQEKIGNMRLTSIGPRQGTREKCCNATKDDSALNLYQIDSLILKKVENWCANKKNTFNKHWLQKFIKQNLKMDILEQACIDSLDHLHERQCSHYWFEGIFFV